MMEILILKILRIAFHSFVLLSLFSKNGFAQPVDKAEPIEWQNPFKPDEVDKAIESGIKFLLINQKDDGAIYDRGNPTAITALSLFSLKRLVTCPFIPMKMVRLCQKHLVILLKNQDEVGYFESGSCTDMVLSP